MADVMLLLTLTAASAMRGRHDVAIRDALDTGCDPVIVALCFAMYGQKRTISVHGAEVRGVNADRGLLAG